VGLVFESLNKDSTYGASNMQGKYFPEVLIEFRAHVKDYIASCILSQKCETKN
jgi:hypothetical protein